MYDAMARNNQRSFMWRKGVEDIRTVKGDIYVCGTGRIFGLPKSWSSVTVQSEVSGIIMGEKDIIPQGMERYDTRTSDFAKPVQADDICSHPYLKNMHFRGGGYAILMAFSDGMKKYGTDFRGPMFKQQIIKEAQPYCDDEMEPNYWSGTRVSGWMSIDTLIRHGLVSKLDNHRARASAGFNRGPQNEYALTDLGARFVGAMLAKYPSDDAAVAAGQYASPLGKRAASPRGSQPAKRVRTHSPAPRSSSRRSWRTTRCMSSTRWWPSCSSTARKTWAASPSTS